MGLSFHQGSTQSPRLGSLTEPSSSILVVIVSTAGTVGTKSSCHREESVAGQGGEFFPLPTASLCLASPDPPIMWLVQHRRVYVFLLFQLGSAAALASTGRSSGERESWGDFWA